MIYHNTQIRMPYEDVKQGMKLQFQGEEYILGETVPETLAHDKLPIGVIMTGYTDQYLLLKNAQPVGAAWFYFYRAMEGTNWAVMDEVETFVAEANSAA